jgi:hypothetical protein
MEKLKTAFELFDTYNQQDPNNIEWEGIIYPAEYFYAVQLHNWVRRLQPDASEPLLLASRSQHIGRWKMPREDYPMNRPGYLAWRKELSKFHAETAGRLMNEAGYDSEWIKAVQHIIRKENIKHDEDVQMMENALCLVFLEFQYEAFISKHDDEKLIRILKKSWNKMSEPGRHAALTLTYSEKGKELIEKALAG